MDYVYHTGYLPIDRENDDDLDELATRLLLAAEQGKMILYQKRCMYGFEYHCVPVRGA